MSAKEAEERTQGERAPYFSCEEQRLILIKYEEEKAYIMEKGNTVAANKRRQNAWQRIADCVNACNPPGVKRTWEQIKTKYKNIVASANRKKNLKKQMGFGGPTRDYTPVEELALSTNKGRAMMDGVSGGVATSPRNERQYKYMQIDESTLMVVMPEEATSDTVSLPKVVVDLKGDGETLSVSPEGAVEEETTPTPADPQASTSSGDRPGDKYLRKRPHKSATATVDALCMRSLETDMEYKELKIEYLKLQIKKLKQELGTGE